jgi:hypothetical protein
VRHIVLIVTAIRCSEYSTHRCAEQLRAAGLPRLANEVELAKASKHLANKNFEAAITVFKVGVESTQ